MLGPNLTVSHLVIAAVCTAVMIGLGYLARPGRATVLWSSVFVLATASAFGSIAAEQQESLPLWLASMGVLLPIPALVWSGLRAARGARRTYAWIAPLIGVGAMLVFVGGFGMPGYHLTARIVVLLGALMNVLVMWELYRRQERGRGVAVPLMVASGAWIVMGVIGLVASAVNILENYALLTQINATAIMAYLLCAVVSLLLITRLDDAGTTGRATDFRTMAEERLRRAQAGGERTWSLLEVRLDDTDDLRAASGEAGFAEVLERFRAAVCASFPAEADVAFVEEGRALVLVARTPAAVQTSIRRLLDDLAAAGTETPHAVQLSASIGWAGIDSAGYDLDALLAEAGRHAGTAVSQGGDRWSRA